MSGYLYGIHEFGEEWARLLAARDLGGWTTTTHKLGHDPRDVSGHDFGPSRALGITPLARLNNGYLHDGTIPTPNRYHEFAARCANFVAASPGCERWIIGNEPNLAIERPQGVTITARDYAACFVACRNAIKAVGGQHQVILAAIGPWNVESGDWLDYWREVQERVDAAGGADGLSIHAYLRSHNPADVADERKMDAAGYTDRYANFRTYRDTMNAVIARFRHLPAYMTEANPLPGWEDRNSGVVQAIYAEVNRWNETPGTQKILCATLFRWPNYGDPWYIEGKPGVLQDLLVAAEQRYRSPAPGGGTRPAQPAPTPAPQPPVPPPAGGDPMPHPAQIDPAATARGVVHEYAKAAAGQAAWRVRRIQWLDTEQATEWGPDHHILGNVYDDAGNLIYNVPLRVTWPSGTETVRTKPNPNFRFTYDYAMSPSLHEFAIQVSDGQPSDVVRGIGMGKQGNPREHTSTVVEFELVTTPQPVSPPPPTPTPPPPAPQQVPVLVHPVPHSNQRTPTQGWGENPSYYSRYKVDGVALRGHNGIDFPTPTGTAVRAVASGTVVEAAFDGSGWGYYVKLSHPWGETLYAHLSERSVQVGQQVLAGQQVGRSGASGVVTGPHLHFGMRVAPFNRQDGWGGYTDPQPYLAQTREPGEMPEIPRPPTPAPTAPGVIDPLMVAAVLDVETRGVAWGPGGKMVIRFEPHIFQERVPPGPFAAHFRLGTPRWHGEHHRFRDPADGEWKPLHGSIQNFQQFEHRALEVAKGLNLEGAYQSTAMGIGQVMGFHARRIGFYSAEQMYKVLSRSLGAQVMAVANFIQTDPALLAAVRAADFEKIAELYNGSGQVEVYARLMREALARLQA